LQHDVAQTTQHRYQLHRLGIIMRPRADLELEAGGVLNPGGARGPDGLYYLFPRLVASGNYSRIGIAQVQFSEDGLPVGVTRLGIALEPSAPYELNSVTGGGCEDPRVTFLPDFGVYVMAYVAYSRRGPRVALALSRDLITWKRLGLVRFGPMPGADMNAYGNKDAMLFPEPVPGPDGRPALALIHRPMYEVWVEGAHERVQVVPPPPGVNDRRWSMWLSYCPLDQAGWLDPSAADSLIPEFGTHRFLAAPRHAWEALRLGGGTPPVRLAEGWLTFYHGIGLARRDDGHSGLRYSAGALVLDPRDPRRILYRSDQPVLVPRLPEERRGVVSDVVFPTAVDLHDAHLDVYYGMADACIGVARTDIQTQH
jgi:predicted GH43/DUF377 family glycosyl hydrolase